MRLDSARIWAAMLDHDLTERQVYTKAGISRETLMKIKRQEMPRLDALKRVLVLLDLSPAEVILNGDQEEMR